MSGARISLGQLLIVGVEDFRWSSRLERMLTTLQPGGVLFSSGCLRTPGQTANLLLSTARALHTPPFLAICEKGGSMDPLKAILPPLPAPRLLARRGTSNVKKFGELIGGALGLLGFNLNFAPRLDLANRMIESDLDTQTFGPDRKRVAECTKSFIDGLRRNKILACGEHFPGQGAAENNENGLAVVGKTMADLWREDLWPFREALPGLPLVKLSNVSYKAYDFDVFVPAAMSSKVVRDLLRAKLGYRGLAVADPTDMTEGSLGHVSGRASAMTFETFANSLKAGCDVQIVNSSADRVLVELQRAMDLGVLSQGEVEVSLRRIRATKRRLKRPSGKLSTRNFDRLALEFEKFREQVKGGGGADS